MNIKSKLSSLQKILDNMEKDHISESSAQCAYYVILSFVPFVILLLTLIQYTSVQPQQLFNLISAIAPSNMSEMVLGIVKEVYSKSFGTMSLSLIFVLFAADRGVFALIKGLHQVYNFNDSKKKSVIYLKLISLLKTIVFIIIMAISLVILVFGGSVIFTMQDSFKFLENNTIISSLVTYAIFMLITFIIFLCIYKFIPGHKITFKTQIRGALFGSIALNLVSFIFSKYLEIFKGFSTIYGSLSALMLVMMWAYACYYIIFLGAEINKFYTMKKTDEIESIINANKEKEVYKELV